MNFALPAVVILVLVLPGFAFRSGLGLREGSRINYSPFGEVFFRSLVAAALLHAAVLVVTYYCVGKSVRLDILMRLMSTGATVDDQQVIQRDVRWIIAYFVALYAAAVLIPVVWRFIVTRFRLDRSGWGWRAWFRFENANWYYLLSGIYDAEGGRPDFIQIAVVVPIGNECFLYTGILEDYFTDADGQLDRLVISAAARRLIGKDAIAAKAGKRSSKFRRALRNKSIRWKKSRHRDAAAMSGERFYPIMGHYLVIHYDEVITLNVHYVKFTQADVDRISEDAVAVPSSQISVAPKE